MQKEFYFTDKNKKVKAETWLTECRNIRSRKLFDLNIRKSVLLVLDMQDYFVSKDSHAHVPSASIVVDSISLLIEKFEKEGALIVFTKHIDLNQADNIMLKWWKGAIKVNDKFSEITKTLVYRNAQIIRKSKYSAFEATKLESILKERGIEQVIITGLMTHLCCETTARDAFMKDFEVFFVVDATATYNEQLHLGSLRAISHGFGVCISVEEILNEEQD